MYKYLLFLMIYFFSTNVNATHLVGGEMNYKYLGEDVYEFSLKVYRDCYLGVPDFDFPAYIVVYTASGVYVGIFVINGDPKTKLPVILDDECYSAPPNVCVERKEYKFNGFLEDNGEGYYISYQRCCRNATILNIFDDSTNTVEDSGMNLFAYLPSPAKTINANPVFNNFPPVAICVNQPLVFDHSAIDLDGDSLVYRLCTPTDALSPDIPSVYSNYFDAIPFDDVRWKEPYSLDNMIGGDIPLTVDSKTGLLVGHPTKIGQYAVGVCVDEYRENELISTTKRDFQFNVAQCGKLAVASFFTYDTICNSLNVQFQNQSESSNSFIWDFGDGTTSTLNEPSHRFATYGSYEVTLIASADGGCADTSSKTIHLTQDNFTFTKDDVTVCRGDSAYLEINADLASIQYIKWDVSPVVYNQNFQYSYVPTRNQSIPFEIKTKTGCTYSSNFNVRINELPLVHLEANPLEIYQAQNVELKTTNNSNYEYQWMFENGQTAAHQNEVSVFMDKSQWVKVLVTNKNTGCSQMDSVFIERKKCSLDGLYQTQKDTRLTCESVHLQHVVSTNTNEVEYFWMYQNDRFDTDTFVTQFNYNTPVNYYLVISQQDVCTDTLTFTESVAKQIPIVQNKTYSFCKEDTATKVLLEIQYTADYYIVIEGVDDTLINSKEIVLATNGVSENIPFTVFYEDSCSVNGQISLQVSDISVQAFAQPTAVLPGEEVVLSAEPSIYEIYQWSPEDIVTQVNTSTTSAIVFENTEFIVLAQDIHGCIAYDTVLVEMKDESCNYENIYIPTAFTPNGDGVNDTWMIRSKADLEIQLQIFNRWGEKVFESNDVQNTWDGTYKGNKAEAGSYAYYMTITCEGLQSYFAKGNITLMR